MPATFERYGCLWPGDCDDLMVEFACIQKGGQWKSKYGDTCGLGLFEHYRRAQSLMWPEDDHHRWSDLILREILANTITAILGPKDSSKTYTSSKYALTDYFAFPETTLILISSTDLRGLEMRVWGDVKSLHERAKMLFPELAGNVLESKHAICTDNLEEDQVRDMRKGLICFIGGTKVDTPNGPQPIETLKPGDEVFNAIGTGIISEVHHRTADRLVRVTLSDGRIIDCTPEHPFFTRRGWTKAIDLKTCDRVFSAYETMSLLQTTPRRWIPQSNVLFGNLSESRNAKKVSPVWGNVPTLEAGLGAFLQHSLRGKVGSFSGSIQNELQRHLPTLRNKIRGTQEPEILFRALSAEIHSEAVRRMRQNVSIYTTFKNETSEAVLRVLLQSEMDKSYGWIKTPFANPSRIGDQRNISEVHAALSSQHREEICEKCSTPLRNRRGLSRHSVGRGVGWGISQYQISPEEGSRENQRAEQVRVESVEILEPASDERFDRRHGCYRVFNLEVRGHPSYSVNGVIVHNCIPCLGSQGQYVGLGRYVGMKQKRRRLISDEAQFMRDSFLDAPANMNSGDFKGIFLGNPLGMDDPLDKVSEPKTGWTSLPEPEKTAVWENRWLNGKTINLVGTDSPNFDPETKDKYKYLINQKSIDNTIAFYTKDSLQYYSQCKGVRRSGINAHRVITREMCEQFGAFDDVIWKGTPITKIAGCDAAYGGVGGDRCVAGHIEFGEDIDGKIVIACQPPVIVPVSIKKTERPEDQIAQFVMDYCSANEIPPENFFFDATGRGSLGTSLARIWSANTEPIEFGGVPTNRPVSLDFYVLDPKSRERRPKLCNEHYSKFVTELWFTVRYVIEARQLRQLPEDVAREGYMREWILTRGDKIEVEKKSDTKLRMNRSPDMFDWLVTCVEGARRRGFKISKLANEEESSYARDWLDDLSRKQRELIHRRDLVYR